ncbi:MAG: molybdenum cofactor biosynthesis protein MoaE [Planctomycetes bacterium]|nr:molybdenum cofactor biosynthesis protein MoaE [Planctomycetota bacterium]
MNITVEIVDGPVPHAPPPPVPGAGAVLEFDGIVRPLEAGRTITALHYQTYEPMAQHMLREAAESVAARHGLLYLSVVHSRGEVSVGACSLRVIVAAPHRAEALAAMAEYIDRLKRDVPIWKSAP